MIKHFRIHGDNIVECERLFNLITKSIQTQKAERYFLSPACPSVKITTIDSDILFFKYFPGFNKNTSDRWPSNIFQILKDNGSFLNETPDVLLTEETDTGEKILLAIEFCSALQAGNQAWQRSGRAYSTARANICPYLYIIDFVKYELDENRNRKALRFPNVAINFDLSTISSKCNCDVLIGFNIDSSTSRCKVQIKGFSSIGNTLAEYLSNIIQHRNSPINIFDIC